MTLAVAKLFAILVLIAAVRGNGEAKSTGRNLPAKRIEILDERYTVEWQTDVEEGTIEFLVLVQTTGFVGFGLSVGGTMTGADIVIGGVFPNGTAYFADYHGIGFVAPVLDEVQNWDFIEGSELNGVTRLRFKRLLETCDLAGDVVITGGTVKIIWAIGSTDTIEQHARSNRGALAVNMLDPAHPPIDLDEFDVEDVVMNYNLTTAETMYWCTVHKRISNGTSHIVAFKPKLETAESLRHTHHFNMYICPPDSAEQLEPYVGQGHSCREAYLPKSLCRDSLYAWSLGGRLLVFPEDVGFPWGSHETEYYLFEAHIDNPEQIVGVVFETGVQIYHTDVLRKQEAGMLAIGHSTTPGITIPPETNDWTIVGHCSSNRTSQFIIPEGVNIINANLHAHLSARKMKLRHFRTGHELPWLANDETYDFDFQENRPLPNYIQLLPGDHVSLECTYSSTWRSPPEAVIGGPATQNEMCAVFMFYYPRMALEGCFSTYSTDNLLNSFGIEEFLTDPTRLNPDPIVVKPEKWAGLSYTQVLNEHVSWTDIVKGELAHKLRYGEHIDLCPTAKKSKVLIDDVPMVGLMEPTTKYPEYDTDYELPTTCKVESTTLPNESEGSTTLQNSVPTEPTTTDFKDSGSNYLHINYIYVLGLVALRILLA